MTTTRPLTYSETAEKVYTYRTQIRNILHAVEVKSNPLNHKQRDFFERWLDENIQVSNVHLFTRSYLDSKVEELIVSLKNLT